MCVVLTTLSVLLIHFCINSCARNDDDERDFAYLHIWITNFIHFIHKCWWWSSGFPAFLRLQEDSFLVLRSRQTRARHEMPGSLLRSTFCTSFKTTKTGSVSKNILQSVQPDCQWTQLLSFHWFLTTKKTENTETDARSSGRTKSMRFSRQIKDQNDNRESLIFIFLDLKQCFGWRSTKIGSTRFLLSNAFAWKYDAMPENMTDKWSKMIRNDVTVIKKRNYSQGIHRLICWVSLWLLFWWQEWEMITFPDNLDPPKACRLHMNRSTVIICLWHPKTQEGNKLSWVCGHKTTSSSLAVQVSRPFEFRSMLRTLPSVSSSSSSLFLLQVV